MTLTPRTVEPHRRRNDARTLRFLRKRVIWEEMAKIQYMKKFAKSGKVRRDEE